MSILTFTVGVFTHIHILGSSPQDVVAEVKSLEPYHEVRLYECGPKLEAEFCAYVVKLGD